MMLLAESQVKLSESSDVCLGTKRELASFTLKTVEVAYSNQAT